MKDKRFRIKESEYFNAYRDKPVFGMTPKEILEHKLCSLGFYFDENGLPVPEDMFCYSLSEIEEFADKKGKLDHDAINDPLAYYYACEEIKYEINAGHIQNGVKIISLDNTYIDYTVKIAPGAVIYPNTYLEGDTFISEAAVIGPDSRIVASKIGKGSQVLKSIVLESVIGEESTVGPFSYIRPGSEVKNKVKIGDFVELKKAVIDDGTKIPHFVYAGDASIGKACNISCGVITANYDGKAKYRTEIGDNVFVGCNSTLVAPVKLEDNTFVAAGSTIVEDVKSGNLAIARAYQVAKEGWVQKTGRMKKPDSDK